MLTPAWTKLNPHAIQSALWRTPARFVAVVAGRGSGKTEISRRRIVRYLAVRKPWTNPIYVYALPVREQAKRIAWKEIKRLVPKHWIKGEPNETELSIETRFGSTLYVVGMDKPHRIEGMQIDGIVVDESSDQRPGSFDLTILPMLSHRSGWAWRIGVPKRHGRGATDFKTFFDKGAQRLCAVEDDLSTQILSYFWRSEEVVSESVLAFARANLSKQDYDEQYRAEWVSVGGRVFYAYDDLLNVTNEAKYDARLPITVGSDFNVDPMAWVVGHRYPDKLQIFDEIWIRNTTTQSALDELHKRYGKHTSGWEFFGDATGKARKTAASSAAQSDYVIIRNDTRFQNAKLFYPSANPHVVDRFASCNAMFCNANQQRRFFVNPKCKQLRADLQARGYIEGTREPDDSGDIGHITDALGYIIHRAYPLRVITPGNTNKVSTYDYANARQ
jgi:hypothetical protein